MNIKKLLDEATGLLPCPFCGNDGKHGDITNALHIVHSEAHSDSGLFFAESYTVQCDMCTATIGYSPEESEAIETWNRRTCLPEAFAELEKAKDFVRRVCMYGYDATHDQQRASEALQSIEDFEKKWSGE